MTDVVILSLNKYPTIEPGNDIFIRDIYASTCKRKRTAYDAAYNAPQGSHRDEHRTFPYNFPPTSRQVISSSSMPTVPCLSSLVGERRARVRSGSQIKQQQPIKPSYLPRMVVMLLGSPPERTNHPVTNDTTMEGDCKAIN